MQIKHKSIIWATSLAVALASVLPFMLLFTGKVPKGTQLLSPLMLQSLLVEIFVLLVAAVLPAVLVGFLRWKTWGQRAHSALRISTALLIIIIGLEFLSGPGVHPYDTQEYKARRADFINSLSPTPVPTK